MASSGPARPAPSETPPDCESCPQLRRFRTLIEASEVLCATLEVQAVLDRILEFVTRELQAERSTLYVVHPASGELVSLIAQGLEEGETIRLKPGEGVAGYVASTGEIVTISNAYTDPRFAMRFDRDSGFTTSSMLAIPLTRSDVVMGVLQVLNRREGFFDDADEQYLLALGNLVAVAIENARLHEEEVMRQRLEAQREQFERELRLARGIQERFLPRGAPVVPGVEVAGLNVPSEHVSGDYYDFFGDGATRLGIVVADVSGHGIPAAILMSVIHAGLRSPGDAGGSPGGQLTFLNHLLYTSTDDSHFATMFVGELDLATRRLVYASGGHPLPVILRADGSVDRLVQGGIPVGMMPVFPYGDMEAQLAPGDILAVFTDGVTEAFRGDEEFGDERLIETIRATRGGTAGDITSAVIRAVVEWGDKPNPEDDVTVIALKVM
jgi:phosphoserine phosphatase RsbU/P